MLVVVWEYKARGDHADEFESFYRPDGPWGTLFRDCPAFVSVTLMKDQRDPLRFMVADRWTSEMLYEEFKRERAEAWRELSERGGRLYERETEVGRFDFVD
jgi:heme-degrading monooxygenase HmoA